MEIEEDNTLSSDTVIYYKVCPYIINYKLAEAWKINLYQITAMQQTEHIIIYFIDSNIELN